MKLQKDIYYTMIIPITFGCLIFFIVKIVNSWPRVFVTFVIKFLINILNVKKNLSRYLIYSRHHLMFSFWGPRQTD
jgi:hypothetical protein